MGRCPILPILLSSPPMHFWAVALHRVLPDTSPLRVLVSLYHSRTQKSRDHQQCPVFFVFGSTHCPGRIPARGPR